MMMTLRRTLLGLTFAVSATFAAPFAAVAQPDEVDSMAVDLQVEQKLGNQVDLGLTFTNDQGKTVELAQYFSPEKPVLLMLVYYECPMLCGQVMNAALSALKKIDLVVGPDFNVVAVSINHREGYELAGKKQRTYQRMYHREGSEQGWNFLTSDSASVAKLADQVGFKYEYDEKIEQYAHSAAIMLLTPEGKVSRYLFGVQFEPRDVQLALVEASDGKVGDLADKLVLLCYAYDPTTGSYGFAISAALKVGAVLTILVLGGFLIRSFRRDRRGSEEVATTTLSSNGITR